MNKLIQSIQLSINPVTMTSTQNGALTPNSSQSSVLDFFSMGGSLRTRSESEVIDIFSKAFSEDRLLALKCLFYIILAIPIIPIFLYWQNGCLPTIHHPKKQEN